MKRQLPGVVVLVVVSAAALWLLEQSSHRVQAADDAKSPAPRQAVVLNYEQSNGKKLFEHYCATCHGATGEGDGFNAFNLNPKPRNVADREAMKNISDQQLFDAISQGGGERGKSNLMPPWGHTLNDRQIRYLVAYLRTLGGAPAQ
jgi:mono/diheme cytochrome c family protein